MFSVFQAVFLRIIRTVMAKMAIWRIKSDKLVLPPQKVEPPRYPALKNLDFCQSFRKPEMEIWQKQPALGFPKVQAAFPSSTVQSLNRLITNPARYSETAGISPAGCVCRPKRRQAVRAADIPL
ncbi:hypothetical protein HMPREF9098_1480 [Kingella denitrificans ATCC 33394]|uniref:Uncharacterized protein n=1 Tax=Kingella denitrificans ATCC 33394 TaxID=888741 RepID=F0F046_9NEIS|nr:hypothetical protein HMPREF9098_1480 [Kingella denitrificans ATCC 33394]